MARLRTCVGEVCSVRCCALGLDCLRFFGVLGTSPKV